MGFNMAARMVSLKKVPKEAKEALEGKVRDRASTEIIMGVQKLVKRDVLKGKVKDVEVYVKKSLVAVRPGTKAGNMCKNFGVTLPEIEAVIRQTIKDTKK